MICNENVHQVDNTSLKAVNDGTDASRIYTETSKKRGSKKRCHQTGTSNPQLTILKTNGLEPANEHHNDSKDKRSTARPKTRPIKTNA